MTLINARIHTLHACVRACVSQTWRRGYVSLCLQIHTPLLPARYNGASRPWEVGTDRRDCHCLPHVDLMSGVTAKTTFSHFMFCRYDTSDKNNSSTVVTVLFYPVAPEYDLLIFTPMIGTSHGILSLGSIAASRASCRLGLLLTDSRLAGARRRRRRGPRRQRYPWAASRPTRSRARTTHIYAGSRLPCCRRSPPRRDRTLPPWTLCRFPTPRRARARARRC